MKKIMGPRRIIKLGILAAFVLTVAAIFQSDGIKNFASFIFPPPPEKHIEYAVKAAKDCGLPEEYVPILLSAAFAESGFNPNAVSYAGALGVVQVLPGTGLYVAKKIGLVGFDRDSFFDPEIGYKLGACYIKDIHDRLGISKTEDLLKDENIIATFVGYNAGPAKSDNYLDGSYKREGPINYGKKVARGAKIYQGYYMRFKTQSPPTATQLLTDNIKELVATIFLRSEGTPQR